MTDSMPWETTEDPEDSRVAAPPVLPRDSFAVCEGLRETTLGFVIGLTDHMTMRRVGQLLASLGGAQGEPTLRDQALAGLIDRCFAIAQL